jgi:hypothetical protein
LKRIFTQHYFYNLVDPAQVKLYGRPPNAVNEALWQKAVRENPDPTWYAVFVFHNAKYQLFNAASYPFLPLDLTTSVSVLMRNPNSLLHKKRN